MSMKRSILRAGFVSAYGLRVGTGKQCVSHGRQRSPFRCASSQVVVTREVVEKTAKLAQFEFTKEEMDRMTKDFNEIIGFVGQMSELDIDGVEPTLRVEEESNVLRDDTPGLFPNQDELLEEAPVLESDFIRVPQILNEQD